MLTNILFAIWFFLPAGIAGTAAVFASKLPVLRDLNAPIDFGREWNGRRIFGAHKTFRGFVIGILASLLIVYLEQQLYLNNAGIREIIRIDYGNLNILLFGILSGFGSMAGDAVKSFFKRRFDIKPGKSWIPFDQIDYILGGILFTSLYIRLDLIEYLYIFVVYLILHPISTVTGYLLKLKDDPI